MSDVATVSTEDPATAAIPCDTVLRIALIGEVLLIVLSIVWIRFRGLEVGLTWHWTSLILAALLTLPLVAVNYVLFLSPAGPRLHHPAWSFFQNRFIRPLCAELSPAPALLVALLAGLGEELAFRGVLLTELRPLLGDLGAVLLSGIIFGWVHFLGLWRDLWPVLVLYCVFGIVIGAVYLAFNDLTLVVLLHALYDFIVITLVYRSVSRSRHPTSAGLDERAFQ